MHVCCHPILVVVRAKTNFRVLKFLLISMPLIAAIWNSAALLNLHHWSLSTHLIFPLPWPQLHLTGWCYCMPSALLELQPLPALQQNRKSLPMQYLQVLSQHVTVGKQSAVAGWNPTMGSPQFNKLPLHPWGPPLLFYFCNLLYAQLSTVQSQKMNLSSAK